MMELSALRSSKKEEEKAAARTHSLKLGTYDSPVKTNLSKAHPSTRTEPHLARSLLMNGELGYGRHGYSGDLCQKS